MVQTENIVGIDCRAFAVHEQGSELECLPCQIDYSGSARVSDFLVVAQSLDGDCTAFRGRKLLGKKIEMPAGAWM